MSENCNSERHCDGESTAEQQVSTETNDPTPELILHNSLVLDLIFDHLPKKDWKSARLVNKTWHSTLQLRWRVQFFYILGYVSCDADNLSVAAFAADFLESEHPTNNPNDLFDLERHPIRNVSIRQTWRKDNYILHYLEKSRFWELFGHGLKRIHLERIRIPEGAFLKRLLFQLTPNLEEFSYVSCVCDDIDQELNNVMEYTPPAVTQKNLKYFKLEIGNYIFAIEMASSDYKPRFPIGWIEFLPAFPNLTKLNLEIDPLDTIRPSDLLKFFKAMDIIRNATNKEVLNISELKLEADHGTGLTHVDVTQVQSLFVSLPISTLYLNVINMRHNNVIRFIQSLNPSLREIKLVNLEGRRIKFPDNVLPQGLTHVWLLGKIFTSLKFVSYLPNLVELRLKDNPIALPSEMDLVVMAPLVYLKKLVYITDSELDFGLLDNESSDSDDFSDTDSDLDSDADSDLDTDSDSDVVQPLDADSDSDTDSDADSDSDLDSDSDVVQPLRPLDADSDSDTDSDSDVVQDLDPVQEADPDPAQEAGLDRVEEVGEVEVLNWPRPNLIVPVPRDKMGILVRLMPNVKTFVGNIFDGGFRTICQGWANSLEHLVTRIKCSEDFFVENMIQLKCLKSLEINQSSFTLTDHLVYEGLLKMPFLTKIILPGYNNISKEGLQALKGKLCDKNEDEDVGS